MRAGHANSDLVEYTKPYVLDHLARLMDPIVEGQYSVKAALHATELRLPSQPRLRSLVLHFSPHLRLRSTTRSAGSQRRSFLGEQRLWIKGSSADLLVGGSILEGKDGPDFVTRNASCYDF
ncbi:hypothetical protein OPV22_025397 [Ensete ventricosum]|uniref:Uncharacterized protein n=1 Tax=Ensete ventricosum TaxID=4639 RepID=A0AAV8QCV8_ENSVE|nr:hypothetical protein OPV22_025397 [Ensete ventricosum]